MIANSFVQPFANLKCFLAPLKDTLDWAFLNGNLVSFMTFLTFRWGFSGTSLKNLVWVCYRVPASVMPGISLVELAYFTLKFVLSYLGFLSKYSL